MTPETTQVGLRERILAEAALLFVQKGYQGVSMREIAEAVGVSKAGLYYHFKDKEALFLGVLLSNIDALGYLVAEVSEPEDIRAQLSALLRGIATRMAGQRQLMRLAEQDAVHLSPETQQQMHAAYHEAFIGQVQSLLQGAQACGELRPLDAQQLTRLFLGLAYPLLSATADEAEARVELVLSVFLEGARAPRKRLEGVCLFAPALPRPLQDGSVLPAAGW